MEIKNKMNLSKLNKNTILTGGTILDPVLGKEKKGNAIKQAFTPTLDQMFNECPISKIQVYVY